MAGPTTTLLLQEHFESGSEQFLAAVLACDSAPTLKAFAPKWLTDQRPFAREVLLKYVDDGCDRPGHRPLVKALFKSFEKRADPADDDVMAHFLVAFDRLPRRRIVKSSRWDQAARQVVQFSELGLLKGIAPLDRQAPGLAAAFEKKKPFKPDGSTLPRFSLHTRLHLKRRAWRYFRKLGRLSPERYRRTLILALGLYENTHLEKSTQLLDAWGLTAALYWGSPVLLRHHMSGVKLAEGQALADLKPAPKFPKIWKSCRDDLLTLMEQARSRTVRLWTVEWLRAQYAASELQGIPVARLRQLLQSPHEEPQLLAADLLKGASGLESLPLADWLDLLRIENPAVVALVCQLVEKNVTPDRLTLAQSVELACGPIAPVAGLGLKWARSKPLRGAIDLAVLMQLGAARTASVRTDAAAWLCELLTTSTTSQDTHLRELIDSRYEEMRTPALELFAKAERYRDSLALWGALSESPYEDARAVLVKHLGEREKAFEPEALRHVWATTLLGVHRGGRAKQIVLNRVARRVADKPGEADVLLPLLGIALRSVRVPERRAALAAVAGAAVRTPSLKAAISRKLPELVLHEGLPA